ncbi:MAG: MotA/TolQ/ExbB proton channel family protein [Lachnospiraceae bacterium]|nr:MotA/TolQ/ExbB proton channel family protein [Lachnospiraceae bacterium]
MDFISVVIYLLGAAVLALLIWCSMRFRKILDAFGRIEVKQSIYEEKLDKKGNIDTTAAVKASYDRRRLEENREAYNKLYPIYAVGAQLIGLFPLLGILGTVLGLISSDLTDIDSLVAGLTEALRTTLWGLVAAIVLKAVDAIVPGKLVNDIDARFDTVDAAIERLNLENIMKEAK